MSYVGKRTTYKESYQRQDPDVLLLGRGYALPGGGSHSAQGIQYRFHREGEMGEGGRKPEAGE